VIGPLRIGTRGSPLALAQTELVRRALQRIRPGLRSVVVPLTTSGDRRPTAVRDLDFTDAIDRRLEDGEIDLAVHSAKDLPARPSRSVAVVAYLARGDPRDCVVLARPGRLRDLPPGARLGSSSLRRAAQLRARRPDLEVVPIRGNIGTRLAQIGPRGLDGVLLAAVGLRRLGLGDRITEYLPADRWLPAPGQGAIAVAARREDRKAGRIGARIDHPPTRAAVRAERAVVRALGGSCELPLGALARLRSGRLRLRATLFAADGAAHTAEGETIDLAGSDRLGSRVGARLRRYVPDPTGADPA
jgi:hydroxymethylbilane synthase